MRKVIDVDTVVVEIIRDCNLRCLVCPTVYAKDFPKGTMSMELFRVICEKLLDVGIRRFGLVGWGEPFLDTGFKDKLVFLKEQSAVVGTTTNAVLLKEDLIKSLLEYGLDYLTISVDVFHLACYRESLKSIVERVKRVRNLSDRTSLFLSVNIVVSKHSFGTAQHLIFEFAGLVDSISVIPPVIIPSPEVLELLPSKAQLLEFKRKFENIKHISFPYTEDPPEKNCRSNVFKNMYVTVEGDVCPCCVLAMEFPSFTFDGLSGWIKKLSFGNLKRQDAEEIIFSDRYINFRKMFLSGSIPESCKLCNAWRVLP